MIVCDSQTPRAHRQYRELYSRMAFPGSLDRHRLFRDHVPSAHLQYVSGAVGFPDVPGGFTGSGDTDGHVRLFRRERCGGGQRREECLRGLRTYDPVYGSLGRDPECFPVYAAAHIADRHVYKRYRITGLQSDAVCLVAERQGAFLHHPFLTVQKDRTVTVPMQTSLPPDASTRSICPLPKP